MADDAVTDGVTAITSTFWESNVRTQVVSRVTANPTVTAGRVIARTDLDRLLVGTDSTYLPIATWDTVSTWTPVVTQSGTVTCTVNRAEYDEHGIFVNVVCALTVTGSGTSGNAITVTLPITAAVSDAYPIGTGTVYDASGTTRYIGLVSIASTTTVNFASEGSITGAGLIGQSPAFGLASGGDYITFTGRYRRA